MRTIRALNCIHTITSAIKTVYAYVPGSQKDKIKRKHMNYLEDETVGQSLNFILFLQISFLRNKNGQSTYGK